MLPHLKQNMFIQMHNHTSFKGRSIMNKFTAVFERDGDWWLGYVEELPGANTQGRTLEEARENLKESVARVIEENRKLTRLEVIGKDAIREELLVAA
jgi:predicted RNase H-like HicB family nuclease